MDDLDSDFSAIHRVDDYRTLPGPRFFSLAMRLAAYPGVMRARVRVATESTSDQVTVTAGQQPAVARPVTVGTGDILTGPTYAARDGWPAVFSYRTAKGG